MADQAAVLGCPTAVKGTPKLAGNAGMATRKVAALLGVASNRLAQSSQE
jgi:hypothetical protein